MRLTNHASRLGGVCHSEARFSGPKSLSCVAGLLCRRSRLANFAFCFIAKKSARAADYAANQKAAIVDEEHFVGRAFRRGIHCPSFRAAVPSDHRDTGTMNSVMGSGAPLNWEFNSTGEPDKSAPHTLESLSGM